MIVLKNKNFAPQRHGAWNHVSPFDPFFGKELQQIFGNDSQSNLPKVNVLETEKSFVIELAAPGMSKEDLKVNVEKEVLVLSSEKKTEAEVKEKSYLKKEFSYAGFKRSFNLPENVDTSAIKANYENGILKIELPKKEKNTEDSVKSISIG